ncbi:hypothetical protein ACFL6M_06930 [Candidatus Eisenbacteria bacterium]|uniref:Uncharacterized protein n=1 Tax=Eiseniibacteriota bacterium TaxID=2212470 RepID=A0ABV6YLV0_UNCEI
MSTWTNNNIAHKNTWATLLSLGELAKGFSESESLKMKDLAFWSHVASGDMNDLRANALAAQLHNLAIMFWAAEYEDGVDQTGAISSISAILRNAEAGVPDLAQVMDDAYQFVGEPEEDFPMDELAVVPDPDSEG